MTNDETKDRMKTHRPSRFGLLVAALSLTLTAASSARAYSPPPLPDLPGADVHVDDGLIIYLYEHRVLIELDMLYELGARPLEFYASEGGAITLWFALAEPRRVFVTQDGAWTDVIDVEGAGFEYEIQPGHAETYGFEIAAPGQEAPTVPDIVLTPIEEPPKPPS